MTAIPLELKLPDDKLKLLTEVAESRQSEIKAVLESIILEWLEQETKLRRARQTLTQFSQGIGQSQPPHNTARNHDAELYNKA